VTLCGEMAGLPRAYVLLLGMGLRSFSMSPAFVPTIKDLASHVSSAQAEAILKQALRLRTTRGVQRFMGQQIEALAPNLRILDSP
jgi:phosphotransferase system enzyme I (PtsI)